MVTRSALISCLASVALLAFASPSFAAASKATAASASVAKSSRAQMNRAFTSKWSGYAQRVYGVTADVWSQRMASSIAAADPTNLSNAMKRDTFEGAMAELSGAGAKLSDAKVIDFLAASKDGNITAQTLGLVSNDLVYTPVQPCRIIDTRNAGGAIGAGFTRSFKAIDSANFTAQGGSATNCGTLGFRATAVAVTLTVVTPAGPGFATAFPFGIPQPDVSSINYTAGAIVNNGLIIQIPNPMAASDFTLFTLAQSHYVADIVGYFAPPVVTALQCESIADLTPTVILPGATGDSLSEACSSGYTIVSGECNTVLNETRLVDESIGGFRYGCQAFNGNVSLNETVTAVARCCRVPGRAAIVN